MQYVPKTGWSQESIQQAVESFGLPGVAHGLFKQGPGDLIEFYESNCNRDLVKYMETLLSSEQPYVLWHYNITIYMIEVTQGNVHIHLRCCTYYLINIIIIIIKTLS